MAIAGRGLSVVPVRMLYSVARLRRIKQTPYPQLAETQVFS